MRSMAHLAILDKNQIGMQDLGAMPWELVCELTRSGWQDGVSLGYRV